MQHREFPIREFGLLQEAKAAMVFYIFFYSA